MAHRILASVPNGTIWDFTTLARNMRLTYESPGGEGELTFEAILQEPFAMLPPTGAKIRVADGYSTFWLGRLAEPALELQIGAGKVTGLLTVTAHGYSSFAEDRVFRSPFTIPQFTMLSAAFKLVRGFLMPDLGSDNTLIQELGRALLSESDDLIGRSARSVFDLLAAFGGANNREAIWHIRTDGTDSPLLEVYERGINPEYQVEITALDRAVIKWPINIVRNRVTVRWKDGRVFAENTASTQNYPTGIGATRDHYVDMSSQLEHMGNAQVLANTLISRFGALRPVVERLTVTYPHVIKDIAGLDVPLWRVRSGKVIRINGLTISNTFFPTAGMFIRHSEWNEATRQLTLQVEEVETIADAIARFIHESNEDPGTIEPEPPGTLPGGGGGELPGAEETPAQNAGLSSSTGRVSVSQLPLGWNLLGTQWIIGNGIDTIQQGDLGWLRLEFPCRLTGWTLTAKEAGSITIQIWKSPTAGFITRTNLATISLSGSQVGSGTLADLNLESGDIVGYEVTVESIDITRINLEITTQRKEHESLPGSADVTSPSIVNLTATNITSSGFRLTFITDEDAFAGADFGPSLDYGNALDYTTRETRSHILDFLGLTSNTQIFVRVKAKDLAGNVNTVVTSVTTLP